MQRWCGGSQMQRRLKSLLAVVLARMPIVHVVHRRTAPATIARRYPGVPVFDVTSRGALSRLSPFYPHGGFPIPGRPGETAASVEGIWQGLKVFEHEGIEPAYFAKTSGPRKRGASQKRGRVLGHMLGDARVDYEAARRRIYLPVYRRQLAECARAEIESLKRHPEIVLLDYGTNGDVADLAKPLSHAALIGRFLNDDWPRETE